MPRLHEWPAAIAASIATLPNLDDGLPASGDTRFWSRVEAEDERALPIEVLAYLARVAGRHDQRGAADRVFAAIWARVSQQIAVYAERRHHQHLIGRMSAEDIVVEVFALLGARLRAAEGITFYEVAFMCGMRRLVCDQGRALDRTWTESLDTVHASEEEHPPRELADDRASEPDRWVIELERHDELQALVHAGLADLPLRARQTALLLMQWHSETAIAAGLGVTTRMVRNYKAQIRAALAGLG